MKTQQELELYSIDAGVQRYRQTIKDRPANQLSAAKVYIKAGMNTLVPAITDTVDSWVRGNAAVGGFLWGHWLSGMSPEKAALVTLSCLYSSAHEQHTYTEIAYNLGMQLNRMLQFQTMRQNDPPYVRRMLAKVKTITRTRFDYIKKHYQGPIPMWDNRTRIAVGSKLMQLAIQHTDMFRYNKSPDYRGRLIVRVTLKPQIRERVELSIEDQGLLSPFYLPMVVKPVDWDQTQQGGYLFIKDPAIRASQHQQQAVEQYTSGKLSKLYDCLNKVQSTAWVVDTYNLQLLKSLVLQGGGVAGIPDTRPIDLPPLPHDVDKNKEALKDWKRQAAQCYSQYARNRSKRVLIDQQIRVAQVMRNYPAIYFRYRADFRYRIYPDCVLSPQTTDTGRGLLKFSKGHTLGQHGYKWLTLGIAGYLGYDKVGYEDRIKHIEGRYNEIKQMVSNPLTHRQWMEADKPFQFLQVCRQWVEACSLDDPSTFISHVRIGVDGTCNGLQHLSALGRDAAGAKHTNLVRSDQPHSIYNVVKDIADQLVRQDCRTTQKETDGVLNPCFAWVGNIQKKTVKTPTLAKPYGVTDHGILGQLRTATNYRDLPGDSTNNLKYLRDVVNKSIAQAVFSANQIMDWLQQVAAIAAKRDLMLRWTNPVGLPVVQNYPNLGSSSIITAFHRLYWRNPKKVKKKRQSTMKTKNGIAPNFVHAIDSAHLMLTVQKAWEMGVNDFGLIHDDYGVHAAKMEQFKGIINQTFVDIHRRNLIQQFAQQVSQYIPDALPPLPELGTLDIEEVLDSPFLFN